VRYTVKGPNSSTVADQSLGVNLTNGRSLGSLPLTLSSSAPAGAYTFEAILTYVDNTNTTITSTANTEFTVAASPPALKPTISVRRPHVEDFNFVARTMFSPGEPIVLVRTVYSTFSAPVAGTVRYQIMYVQNLAYDQTVNTTFQPGMNTSFLSLSTGATLPVGTYTFNVTATAQGEQSTSSTSFLFSGPRAPALNFDQISRDEAQPADIR